MILYEPPSAAERIPLIDFSGAFSPDRKVRRAVAWEIHKASRETGFFYILGHGVPSSTMAAQLEAARRFFAQALDKKLEIHVDNSSLMRGYEPLGGQVLDPGAPPDIKESVVFGRELGPDHDLVRRGLPFEGANPWPRDLDGFRAQVEAYTAHMVRLGQALAASLCLSLDLDEDHLADGLAEPNCAVRMLHYPPHPPTAAFNQLGAGAHTDWGLLTILLQDDRGGLEVRNADGVWIRADPVPGAFVINLGEMAQRFTNGAYRSNSHRVLNNVSGKDRYSVATFFNPPFDYVFRCAPTCLRPGEVAPQPCSFGVHIQSAVKNSHPFDR